jgi:hypothetical protein
MKHVGFSFAGPGVMQRLMAENRTPVPFSGVLGQAAGEKRSKRHVRLECMCVRLPGCQRPAGLFAQLHRAQSQYISER